MRDTLYISARHGKPTCPLSDNGSQFHSNKCPKCLQDRDIVHKTSTQNL